MKRFVVPLLLLVAAAGVARGLERDLEVTIEVVPTDSSASGAIGEIRLPDIAPADAGAPQGTGSSPQTGNQSLQFKQDLGKDMGRGVSEAARERARQESARERARQGIPPVPPKPPGKGK